MESNGKVEESVGDFDHHSGEMAEDPSGFWRELRRTEGIPWSNAYGGFHVVGRFDEVCEVARRPNEFSSAEVGIPTMPTPLYPLILDPPMHTEFRRLLTDSFSRRAAAGYETRMREIARALLRNLENTPEFDFVEEFAFPLPMQATMEIIGFPPEEAPTIASWLHDIEEFRGLDDERAASAGMKVVERFKTLILEYRSGIYQGGVISVLLNGTVMGRPLSEGELIATISNLVFGALGTTSSVITWALHYLWTHPSDWSLLSGQPDLINGAVDEFLRVAAAATSTARIASVDTEISGCPVAAGERVLLVWGSASRDEARFINSDTPDFLNPSSSHVAFGFGVHRCIGSHVAKVIIKVALEEALASLQGVELVPGTELTWRGGELRGMVDLPVRRIRTSTLKT
jgi:cytochrome P450